MSEELRVFEIGSRSTDWFEFQEKGLQKGIRDGFYGDRTKSTKGRKKREVSELKTSEGKKNQANDIFIKYYDDYTSGKNFTENTWIADSSTTCHVTNDESGLYEVTEVRERVRLGDGQKVTSTKKGKLEVVVPTTMNKKGTTITLENVQFIPKFPVMLFSLLVVLKNSAEIKSADRKLTISKSVTGCAGIKFTFTACDNKAKS